ncbi:[LysW]-aminoadipate kinase [Candidatus Micrarchaeota archaeon]|nr:[LysW]-aminoadipate kinase [Candidatus Micrarchaeota archaeon]
MTNTQTNERPIIVVKIGGSTAQQPEEIAKDIASLQSKYSIVVVHGGSAQINELCKRLNITPKFITSPGGFKSRYTNAEVLQAYTLALRGEANSRLVVSLNTTGVNAIGLSGCDGRLIEAKQKIITSVDESGKQKIVRDDYTGKIEKINGGLLRTLLREGYVPVVAALALGETSLLNIDGDRLAAKIGSELKANTVVMLTDVDGYYKNFPNDLVSSLTRAQLTEAIEIAGGGKASGGMKKKLFACAEAIDGGVQRVVIGNGKTEAPLSKALDGSGTHITANRKEIGNSEEN